MSFSFEENYDDHLYIPKDIRNGKTLEEKIREWDQKKELDTVKNEPFKIYICTENPNFPKVSSKIDKFSLKLGHGRFSV
jgi:hypothetical protein